MYKTKLLISYCTLLICMMAFYNKFPLLTPESGLHIDAGFSGNYLFSIYGFFIAHSSWGKSLWPVVITQAAFLSVLFYFWFKYLAPSKLANLLYMCCVFLVSFCMSGSVVSSTISPGVFKGIGLLSLGLILLVKNLSERDYRIVIFILLLSGLVDFGTTLSIISLSLIWAMLGPAQKIQLDGQLTRRKLALPVVCVVLLCFFCIQGQAYWLKGNGWRFAKIAFFVKTDLLPKYLAKKAEGDKLQHTYSTLDAQLTKLTPIKDGISPAELKHLEYNISEMSSQPGYVKNLIEVLLGNVVKQSLNIPIELYPIQYHNSNSFQAVYHWFNWESREYLITRQLQNWLDLRYPGYMQMSIICLLSIAGIVMLILKVKSKAGPVFLFCYLAYFLQAFFTSMLDGAVVKLDNQLVWLLLLPYLAHLSHSTILQRLSTSMTRMNAKSSSDEA